MLRDWLAPTAVDEFVRTTLRRTPVARPGAAAGAVPLFGWETLAHVLARRPEPDVLVAAGGRLAPATAPRTLEETRALMDRGLGVVVREAERHDPGLATLAAAFARDLPGDVHVQLYITPAGTQTFGWHFDFEDVFIAQTLGQKDYYFRDNTVANAIPAGPRPDFSLIRRETTPLFSARLIPGDWLYIPARWWHLVRSVDDALSISIGVVPRTVSAEGDRPPAPVCPG